jgi:HK97 family phage portal protein
MSRPTFWEICVGHCVLSGNAYIYKVRNGLGQIAELWPVDPRSVTVRRDQATNRKTFVVGGDSYTRDDICHIPAWGIDGLTGLSPIAQAREALGIALGAEQGSATFYAQGSAVSGVITTTQELNDQQATELQRRWQKMHAGARNFHKVGVFGSGASWQQIGLSPADAQFLDARKYSVEEIARLFRVPPHMLGDVDRSTSWGRGLEEQQQAFVTYTLMPWLSRFEAAITDDLLPVADRYAKFDLDSLLRGKAVERAQTWHLHRVMGTMSKNEIRDEEDMPPIVGGDGDDYDAPLNSNISPAKIAGNGGDGGQGQDNQDGTANDGSLTGGE